MASHSQRTLGWGLALGLAAGAWGQSLKPLEYSRKAMSYDGPMYYNPDTILIRNPNTVDLRCDSIVMLLGQSQLYGLHIFHHRETATGNPKYLGLYPRLYGHPDSSGRVVFPYAEAKLDFPGRKQLMFIWQSYDPCPVCKVSAAASSADSVKFRLVLHVRGMQDTLSMTMDRRFTVGITARGPHQAAPTPSPDRDAGGEFRGANMLQ